MNVYKQTKFCRDIEFLTFTEASLIAPLTLLTLLYLPTILYVTVSSIKFYGWANWATSVLDDPVHFIFPIFTNISFYKRGKRNKAVEEFPKSSGESIEMKQNQGNLNQENFQDIEVNSTDEHVFGDLQVIF